MKWKPEIGEIFYSVDLIGDRKYVVYHWFDEDTESSEMLEAGIVFKTKEEAIAATELCLLALRGELVRKEDVIKRIKGIYTNVREYQRVIDLVIEAVEEL